MIFICVKWTIRPEKVDSWLSLVDEFTQAMAWMPRVVAETPQIINVKADSEGWSRMAEVQPAG